MTKKWKSLHLAFMLEVFVFVLVLPMNCAGQPNEAPRSVYVATNHQDYMRLVPASVHSKYVPLLYSENGHETESIKYFTRIYAGQAAVLNSEAIDALYTRLWPRADVIVVSESRQDLALLAAAIAATQKAPLYFKSPPAEALSRLHVRKVIAVGGIPVEGMLQVERLSDLKAARFYYEGLLGTTQTAVLAGNNEMAFLATEVAAYHRAVILFEPSEIGLRRPRILVWVTIPREVTFAGVQNLYSAARFTPGSKVYDSIVGIITANTPHDAALLIARAYAYPKLAGPWKMRLVEAATDAPSGVQSSRQGALTVTRLNGGMVTKDRLVQDMQSAGHVLILAHGSPSGLALAGGSMRGSDPIPPLPPLVFVAESCLTANLAEAGTAGSIALRLVEAGAAAYVGSMETGGVGLVGDLPFYFSTPRQPLGELVRLQNAARVGLDADVPRAILIGDPTFHQSESEWADYRVLPRKRNTGFAITSSGGLQAVLALQLPDMAEVAYAEAWIAGVRRSTYITGSVSNPLGVAPAFGRQSVLLQWPGSDGELILYSSSPPRALVRRAFEGSLLGLKAVLVDLLSVPGLDIPIAVISLGLLLVVASWRRPFRFGEGFWAGVLTGSAMGMLDMLFCWSQGYSQVWLGVAATASGAAAIAWVVWPRHAGWKRVALGTLLFLSPVCLLSMLLIVLRMSARAHILILSGASLVGMSYAALLIVADQVCGRIFKAVPPQRRGELSDEIGHE